MGEEKKLSRKNEYQCHETRIQTGIPKYQMEELVPIVAELAASYAGYEHTSISYERAQMFMGAVIYCIREYERTRAISMTTGATSPSAREAYDRGYQRVLEKAGRLQQLYNKMLPDFQDYQMKCLRETVTEGIPAFLLHYDAKYAPQDTILTLDYPVLESLEKRTGVDTVFRYLQCIALEQRFLGIFPEEYVQKVLKQYDANYEELLENICEIILGNMLGHLFLKKPLQSYGFSKEDYTGLEHIFTEKEAHYGENREYADQKGEAHQIETKLSILLENMLAQYFPKERSLAAYLKKSIPNLASRIKEGAVNHSLYWIFIL